MFSQSRGSEPTKALASVHTKAPTRNPNPTLGDFVEKIPENLRERFMKFYPKQFLDNEYDSSDPINRCQGTTYFRQHTLLSLLLYRKLLNNRAFSQDEWRALVCIALETGADPNHDINCMVFADSDTFYPLVNAGAKLSLSDQTVPCSDYGIPNTLLNRLLDSKMIVETNGWFWGISSTLKPVKDTIMQWDFSQKLEDLSLQIVEPGSAIPKQMNYWLRTPVKKVVNGTR